jgi:hypothetical protein
VLLAGSATATGHAAWRFTFQPFQGRYSIYGGSLADPEAPSARSKKIAFSINGKAAQQMFDAMGPDLKSVCDSENGTRFRQRAELVCSYHPTDGYECNFGFDLAEGRSIGGSVC